MSEVKTEGKATNRGMKVFTINSQTNDVQLIKASTEPKSLVSLIDSNSIAGNIAYPKYNFATLRNLALRCSILRACIDRKRDLTLSNGYAFYNLQNDISNVKNWSDRVNADGDTLGDLLSYILLSFITYENAFVEIRKSGDAVSIYNLDATRVVPVISNDGTYISSYGYIQNNMAIKQFKNANRADKIVNGSYIYHIKSADLESFIYSYPSWLSVETAIYGTIGINEYVNNFFKNNGRFDYMLIVKNIDMDEVTQESIRDALNNVGGVKNAHKNLFFSFRDDKADFELIQLQKDDSSSYLNQQNQFNRDIISIMGLRPDTIGYSESGSSLGGNEAIGSIKLDFESTIKPLQKFISSEMNKMFTTIWGVNPQFRIKELNLIDPKTEAIIWDMDIKSNQIPIEYARAVRYPDYDESQFKDITYFSDIKTTNDTQTNKDTKHEEQRWDGNGVDVSTITSTERGN